MKNIFLLLLSLFLSFGATAQKKELKAAEKALKKKNYATSLDQLEVVSSLLENAAPKLIEKYYYLKAAALFEDGTKILHKKSSLEKPIWNCSVFKKNPE